MKLPSKRILATISICLIAAVLLGAIYIKKAFDRPGESAIPMVPRDAEAIVVFDLTPGIHQLGAFRKLASLADGADLGKDFDGFMDKILGENSWVKDLLPFGRRSAVIAEMPSRRNRFGSYIGSENGLLIIPVSDSQKVRSILKSHLNSEGEGFSDSSKKIKVDVINDALVIANQAEDLDEVRACASGKKEGFSSLEEYLSARKAIDSDANLMLFIASSKFRSLGDRASAQWRELSDAPGWFGAGIALRDTGLALSCNIPFDSKKWEPYKDLAAMHPIRKDLLAHLPAGAYSIGAVSQPEKLWTFTEDALAGDQWSMRSFRDFSSMIQREAGIDIEGSLSSALKGTAVYGLYPASSNPTDGVDAVVLFDDSSGAKPAELVERVRRYAERFIDRQSNGDRIFTSLDLGKVDAYKLSRDVRMRAEDDMLRYSDETSRKLLHGKTIAYALVKDAVLVATSEDLLAKTVKAYQGEGDLLSSDSQFSSSAGFDDNEGPQLYFAANIARICEAADADIPWNQLPKEAKDAGKEAVETLRHMEVPVSVSLRAGPNAASVKVVIPLDFDRISEFIKSHQAKIHELTSRFARSPGGSGFGRNPWSNDTHNQSAANTNARALATAVQAKAIQTGSYDTNLLDYATDLGGSIPLNPCTETTTGYTITATANSAIVAPAVGTNCGEWTPMTFSLTLDKAPDIASPPPPVAPATSTTGIGLSQSQVGSAGSGAHPQSSGTSARSTGDGETPRRKQTFSTFDLMVPETWVITEGNAEDKDRFWQASEPGGSSFVRIEYGDTPEGSASTAYAIATDKIFARKATQNHYRRIDMHEASLFNHSAYIWEFEKSAAGGGIRHRKITYFDTDRLHGAIVLDSAVGISHLHMGDLEEMADSIHLSR